MYHLITTRPPIKMKNSVAACLLFCKCIGCDGFYGCTPVNEHLGCDLWICSKFDYIHQCQLSLSTVLRVEKYGICVEFLSEELSSHWQALWDHSSLNFFGNHVCFYAGETEKQRRFMSKATGTKIFRCKNVDHSKGVERGVLKVYMTNHPINLVSARSGRTSCKTSITLTDEYP